MHLSSPVPDVLPLPAGAREALQRLPSQLARHGYDEPGLLARLGLPPTFSASRYLERVEQAHLVFAEEGPTPLEALCALFLLGSPVEAALIEPLIERDTLGALEAASVLRRDGPLLQSACSLVPVWGLYLACDFRARRAAEDFVFFPDHSTASLVHYLQTLRPEGERALDLGTGSGAVALLSARRGAHRTVVGQDLNPRAVALARLGAAVNGLPAHFEVAPASALRDAAAGSLAQVTFTLPQLYTAPFTRAVSIHAAHGDRLLDEVYSGLAHALAPGGHALLFHQSRTPADTFLEARLSRIPGRERLGIRRITLPTGVVGARFGLSHVRRSEDAPSWEHVSSPALEPDPSLVSSLLHTQATLRTEDWTSVPLRLGREVMLQRRWLERYGELLDLGFALGEAVLPTAAAPLIHQIDGRKTAQQLLAGLPPEAREGVRDALLDALRGGALRFATMGR